MHRDIYREKKLRFSDEGRTNTSGNCFELKVLYKYSCHVQGLVLIVLTMLMMVIFTLVGKLYCLTFKYLSSSGLTVMAHDCEQGTHVDGARGLRRAKQRVDVWLYRHEDLKEGGEKNGKEK
jgi:hypothetical protein